MFIVDVWENEIAIPFVNIKKFFGKTVNISRTENKVWLVFREPGQRDCLKLNSDVAAAKKQRLEQNFRNRELKIKVI